MSHKSPQRFASLSHREEWEFFRAAIRPFFWSFLVLVLMMLVLWAASCVSPMLQKRLIDALTGRDRDGVLLFGGLTALSLCAWRGGEHLWLLMGSMLSIRLGAALKQRYFRHLLQLPLGLIESGGAGYLGQRLHVDIECVTGFFCSGAPFLLLNLLRLTTAMILLGVYDWKMMLAGSPVLLLFFGLTWYFRSRQYDLSVRINEAAAEYRRNMQNSLDRVVLFKSRSGENRVGRRVGRDLEKLTMLRISRVRWERFYSIMLQVLPAIWFGGIWCFGAAKVLDGEWKLGELWAVSGYMLLVFAYGKMFFSGLLSKRNSDAAVSRLMELGRMLPETVLDTPESRKLADNGEIAFEDISFSYPGGKEVFRNFSLRVADGEHLGIYGPSGGGKSTLGALLLRLYEVSGGEIRLAGRNIRDYSLTALRQSIGYIGQSAELFYASVRENLSHGGGYPDHRIIDALRRAGLGSRLDENPDLLDLKIREDGSNFSAGERLKLALARELLRQDTRVLVLDEATAALDRESEKKVFELLRGELRNRTVVFISHRDFGEGVMDRIIRIAPPGQ